MSDEKLYETAQLSGDFAGRIIRAVESVERFSLGSRTEAAVTKMKQGASAGDGIAVANAYKTLSTALEGGDEDDEMMGVSVMNGSKKAAFQDLLTEASVVYGYVYDDASKRTVRAQHVFAETQRAD